MTPTIVAIGNSSDHDDNNAQYCVSFRDVVAASERINNTIHKTPVLTSSSLNCIAKERNLYFKVEAFQKTGSFKFRGALNAVRCLLEERQQQEQGESEAGTEDFTKMISVVTHSSGNHAQALALAAKLASTENITVNATIVMPMNTPSVKQKAVNGFGGTIVLVDNSNQARENEAERIRLTTGAAFIHPSEDPRVIAGQGTVCLEFIEQCFEMMKADSPETVSNKNSNHNCLDAIIIPVGGGGLAAGNIITIRHLMGNSTKIILAEPVKLNDAKRSLELGTIVQHDVDNPLDSVADGLKTTLGPNTWPIIRDYVDDIITVSEIEILQSTKLVWERLKVCIEPSAGVGVAVALYSTEFQAKYPSTIYKNIGIILCGGNVDLIKISSIMSTMGL